MPMALTTHREQIMQHVFIAYALIRQVMHFGGGLFADNAQSGVNL